MAAGMGSRYGGLKQIDPVGPSGETIMDYSVFDALRAGFGKLVFIIRREIEAPFRETIGARFEGRIPVSYVFQELDKLPPGFTPPAGRKKPWGTAHAILMAAEAVKEPFAVINADDFYGPQSFQLVGRHLQSGTREHAMVGFVLKNTLSEFGMVARGVCRATPDDFLQSVTELTQIERDGDGAKYTAPDGKVQPLSGTETVSMNMWGFCPSVFEHLQREFTQFLRTHPGDEKAEFYITSAVTSLVAAREQVKVLHTPDSWFGVTYRDDRPRVVESIRRLIASGAYPEKLW